MGKEDPPTSNMARKEIIRILHLEDNADDAMLCQLTLRESRFEASVDVVETTEQFTHQLEAKQYDVILADYQLQGWNGMDAFEILSDMGIRTPFIIVSGVIGDEKACECVRNGVSDFVLKNNLHRLPMVIDRALRERRLYSERESSVIALRESEQKFRALAESVASGILIYHGIDCQYANRAAEEITGYSREELSQLSSWEIIHPDSRDLLIDRCLARLQSEQPSQRLELKIITKKGLAKWVDMTLGKIEIQGEPGGLFTINDITERKAAEEEILQMAGSDPLTGVANGRYLANIFKDETRRYSRTERPFSLLVFDLDGLKQINDTYGHLVGSRALCRLAHVLRSQCRNIDLVARQGGDEFIVILPETAMIGAQAFAHRIMEQLSNDHQNPQLAVCFGAAVYPGHGTYEELFAIADEALYGMKRRLARSSIRDTPRHVAS